MPFGRDSRTIKPKIMAKSYHGYCFRCKQYGEVTFRSTKSTIDEETGLKKKSKRFTVCLNCVH